MGGGVANGNVACHCHLFSPMSYVTFKKRLCPVPLFLLPCRMSLGHMSHVALSILGVKGHLTRHDTNMMKGRSNWTATLVILIE